MPERWKVREPYDSPSDGLELVDEHHPPGAVRLQSSQAESHAHIPWDYGLHLPTHHALAEIREMCHCVFPPLRLESNLTILDSHTRDLYYPHLVGGPTYSRGSLPDARKHPRGKQWPMTHCPGAVSAASPGSPRRAWPWQEAGQDPRDKLLCWSNFGKGTRSLVPAVPLEELWVSATVTEAIECHQREREETPPRLRRGGHAFPPRSSCSRTRRVFPRLAPRGHGGPFPVECRSESRWGEGHHSPPKAETQVTFTACRAEPGILPQ